MNCHCNNPCDPFNPCNTFKTYSVQRVQVATGPNDVDVKKTVYADCDGIIRFYSNTLDLSLEQGSAILGLELTGYTGATGPMGSIGVTGPTGPQGITGPLGAQGQQGPPGITGPTNLYGYTGPQGPDGQTGIGGIVGVTGPQGSQGVQGIPGPQGILGVTGPTGAQGNQGNQGPSGPQGVVGVVGNTGSTGADGNQGPSGPQGNIGPTGATGYLGVPGPLVCNTLLRYASSDDFNTTFMSQLDIGGTVGLLGSSSSTSASILLNVISSSYGRNYAFIAPRNMVINDISAMISTSTDVQISSLTTPQISFNLEIWVSTPPYYTVFKKLATYVIGTSNSNISIGQIFYNNFNTTLNINALQRVMVVIKSIRDVNTTVTPNNIRLFASAGINIQ